MSTVKGPSMRLLLAAAHMTNGKELQLRPTTGGVQGLGTMGSQGYPYMVSALVRLPYLGSRLWVTGM